MSIVRDLPNILRLIDENKVVKIVAPTGSGKTTILSKELGKIYNVTAIVSNPNSFKDLNYLGVTFISPEQYWSMTKNNSDIIVLDEVDRDSLDNYLIILDWKKNYSDKKLILMSLLPHSYFPEFPTYIISHIHPIEIRYTKDFEDYEESIDYLIDLVYNVHMSSVEGDFLIFVADKEYVAEKINSLEISDKERKIVVSDNDGKTILKNTKYGCIFDTMREIREETTLTGGRREKVEYISKRDAELRSKRCSKSCIVYRLISKETYDTLPEVTKESLLKLPLHILLIELYERRLNPFETIRKNEIKEMMNFFINHGLLNISLKLTDKALLIKQFPLGLKPALLALEMNNYGGIVLASLIDSFEKSPFLFNKNVNLRKELFEYEINADVHIEKYYSKFRKDSDLETLFEIFLKMRSSKKDMEKWCAHNAISYEYMKSVSDTVEETLEILKNTDLSDILKYKEENLNWNDLEDDLKEVISKLYSDRIMKLDKESTIYTQYYDSRKIPYSIDALAVNTIEEKRPFEIYSLITSSIPNEGHKIISLSYVSPTVIHQEFEEEPIVF